jgi:hypothetical protein
LNQEVSGNVTPANILEVIKSLIGEFYSQNQVMVCVFSKVFGCMWLLIVFTWKLFVYLDWTRFFRGIAFCVYVSGCMYMHTRRFIQFKMCVL